MAILANRVKIRNNLIELSKFAIFSIRKVSNLAKKGFQGPYFNPNIAK